MSNDHPLAEEIRVGTTEKLPDNVTPINQKKILEADAMVEAQYRRLTTLLYILMWDHVPVGELEHLVHCIVGHDCEGDFADLPDEDHLKRAKELANTMYYYFETEAERQEYFAKQKAEQLKVEKQDNPSEPKVEQLCRLDKLQLIWDEVLARLQTEFSEKSEVQLLALIDASAKDLPENTEGGRIQKRFKELRDEFAIRTSLVKRSGAVLNELLQIQNAVGKRIIKMSDPAKDPFGVSDLTLEDGSTIQVHVSLPHKSEKEQVDTVARTSSTGASLMKNNLSKVASKLLEKGEVALAREVLAVEALTPSEDKTKKVLTQEMFDSIDWDPLLAKIYSLTGIMTDIHPKLEESRRGGKIIKIESANLADKAGILAPCFKEVILNNFGGNYTEGDNGYWLPVHFHLVLQSGGTNGVSLMDAWYGFTEGKWEFKMSQNSSWD